MTANREGLLGNPAPEGRGADEALLREFLAGDAAAVRRVERWAWEIVHFRWSSLDAEAGEDIVQEAVTGVWRAVARPGFELRVSFRALVRRVAAARCIDRLRRRRPSAPLEDSLADPAPTPYDELLRSSEQARLRWAVQNLGERCRELIREHYFEERPYAEIASRLGRSEATMRVHMFNCLKAARKLWERFA